MEKSVLETNEMYTIDDLKARKEEAEGLEKINEQVTAELEKIIVAVFPEQDVEAPVAST